MLSRLESSFWYVSLTETVIRQIYSLANTPFEASALGGKWQEFGWGYTPATWAEPVTMVKVNNELELLVGAEGEQIECVILPFCYWRDYEEEWHDSVQAFQQERHEFDSAYDRALSDVESVLGRPFYFGQDQDDQAHRYALWQGDTSVLILQQAAFDVQFGVEINLWIEPNLQVGEFSPPSNLIEWLTNHRQ